MRKSIDQFHIQRTVTKVADDGTAKTGALESYRSERAYVLLGEPGSGKTTAFEAEAKASGGRFVTARNFVTLENCDIASDTVLFIDALDELRAIGGDPRELLDRVRTKLSKYQNVKFRLSCREADWLGESDRRAIEALSANGSMHELRLDPLTDADVRTFIYAHYPNINLDDFLLNAEENGINQLLYNPQTLHLIAKIVDSGNWPNSRQSVYEQSCCILVAENNVEHIPATDANNIFGQEDKLDAAGYICATLLLSGHVGYTIVPNTDSSSTALANIPGMLEIHRSVLRTGLFASDGVERIPIHRSIAEFLGAKFIAKRLHDRAVSFVRVETLMRGTEHGYPSDLRGLAAWLATLGPEIARTKIIERDPLGVVLYGDVRLFAESDKRRIFDSLQTKAQNNPLFRTSERSSTPFGALCTSGLSAFFIEMLKKSSIEESDQIVLECVLDTIRHGKREAWFELFIMPLDALVRNGGYWPRVRSRALRALVKVCSDKAAPLIALAADIRDGKVADGDDQLLGILLEALYPDDITPEKIFDYLHAPQSETLIGDYVLFWIQLTKKIPETPEQVTALIEACVARWPVILPVIKARHMQSLSGEILACALELNGDNASVNQLYDWLGISIDEYSHPQIENEHRDRVVQWLIQHPKHYKSIYEYSVERLYAKSELQSQRHTIEARLLRTPLPDDFIEWCFEQASEDQRAEVSDFYFQTAISKRFVISELNSGDIEMVWKRICGNERHRAIWMRWTSTPRDGYQRDSHLRNQNDSVREATLTRDRVISFRQYLAAIEDGTAHAQLFHQLGMVYYGIYYEFTGETPEERLSKFFGNDKQLANAALIGLKKVLFRDDLPTVSEIVDLEVSGQMHYIRLACLAGMDLLASDGIEHVSNLPQESIRQVIAFHLTMGITDDSRWFTALLDRMPDVVTPVLIEYSTRLIQSGKEHVSHLHIYSHNLGYAKAVLPHLFSAFPVRAKKLQIAQVLRPVMMSSLKHFDKATLLGSVQSKLKLKSLDPNQRVCWLACGLLLLPDKYKHEVFEYTGHSENRRIMLSGFLQNAVEDANVSIQSLGAVTILQLVELLGQDTTPEFPTSGSMYTQAHPTADFVSHLIGVLRDESDRDVSQQLRALSELSNLRQWRLALLQALEGHRIARLNAQSVLITPNDVANTLLNRDPSSAADLAAIVSGHLQDLARNIRNGSTNDYRQYWSYVNAHDHTTYKPKVENDCRDALLGDLKMRLANSNISAEREASYADDTRADIRVSYKKLERDFNLPVEIKRSNHHDVWVALKNQLIDKYTRDPGASGYGIYLVLWFGPNYVFRPSDGRAAPKAKSEMLAMLEDELSVSQRNRITVHVIDCSLPNS